ncbi:MAG: hypothetical protein LUH51_07870 [Firmicutes bacterium]|nr:hypothetical protein [Bacillota bacterium]
MTQTQELQQVKCDRMRYTKDKFSANLVLVAIVFDALYFVSIYQSDVGSYYYTWLIGASIIYNLLFMLLGFLASEGVKSRKSTYTLPLLLLGVMQFVRMVYLPAKAHAASVEISGETIAVMEDGQYIYVLVCLAISGVCCLVAAVASYLNNKKLAAYLASIEKD